MGRFHKRKQQLKRLVEAMQARHDKDEFGREEEEVIVFDDETTVDVDIDALGKDAVWQEEELEFKDVEEPVGNLERSKRRCRQKQKKAIVGTKKLTSFFAPV
jgi:hypothetical protein